jgi:hypothetical protein
MSDHDDANKRAGDDLDETGKDQLLDLVKAAVGLAPGGALIAELIDFTIPKQREDRIVAYLRELASRLEALEARSTKEILERPDKVEFVEEGARQASRALSEERIGYIAEAVSRGLTSEEADVIRRKRLLNLLGELDDDELQLLNAYGQSYGSDGSEAWDQIDRPEPAHLGSPVEDIDREKLYEAGKAHLLRLGLLDKRLPQVKRGDLPEFDTYRRDWKHTIEISYIGRMLLREIGLPTPFDAQQSTDRKSS